jgi:L-ascorbate metabolism protein UlaG (beta-lactamase superfamily)
VERNRVKGDIKMEIEFFGANCFRIRAKGATVVVDDDLDSLGLKNVTKEDNVLLVTNKILKTDKARSKARLVLDSAGEFEVGDISVNAIQTRGHMDKDDEETAIIYQCLFGGNSVTILGHVHPDINGEVLELIGGTDVLILPVGGNGFTLDPVGATSIIKKSEADVVIPSQYELQGVNYEVSATPLEEFVKVSGMTAPEEQLDQLKVGKIPCEVSSQTQLIVLNMKKA